VSRRLRLIVALWFVVALLTPAAPLRGAGWAPGERLPSLIVSEVNRRIAGSLRAKKLSWRVPNTVVAQDVAILDPDGKLVALAESLEASLEVSALTDRSLHITRAVVKGLRLNLVADARGLNIARAFKSSQEKASDDAPLQVVIDSVKTTGADVLYRRERLAVAIAGLAVSASLTAEGKDFHVVSPLRADRVAVQIGDASLRVEQVSSTRIAVDQTGLRAALTSFQIAGAESELEGRIRWGEDGGYALDGKIALPSDYWPDGVKRPELKSGPLRAGLSLRGTLAKPVVKVDLAPIELRVAGRTLHEVSGKLRIDNTAIHSDAISGRFAGGRFTTSATYRFESRSLAAKAALSAIALSKLTGREDISGALRGELEVEGTLAQPWSLQLGLEGTLRKLELGAVRVTPAHALRLAAVLDAERLAIGKATLRGPVLSASVRGPVRFEPRALELEADVTVKQLAALHEQLAEVESAPLRWQGQLSGPFDDLAMHGELRGARLDYAGVVAESLRARVRLGDRSIEVDRIGAQIAEGQLSGTLRIGLGDRRGLRGGLELTGAALATLARTDPAQLSGALALSTVVGGSLDAPELTITARAPAVRVGGAGPYVAEADLAYRQRVLEITRLQVTAPGSVPLLEAHGAYTLADRALEGELQIHPSPLKVLPYAERYQLAGQVAGSARVTGTLALPVFDAQLQLERAAVAGSKLGEGTVSLCGRGDLVRAAFIFDEEAVALVPCVEPSPPASARGSGWVAYDRGHRFLETRLRLRDIELGAITAQIPELAGVTGTARGDLRLQGPVDQLRGRGSFRVDGVAVDEHQVGAVVIGAELAHGLINLTVDAWDQIRGGGVYDTRDGRRRLEGFFTLAALEPENLSATLRQRGARGALNGEAHVIYDPDQTPAFQVDATLQRAILDVPPAQPIRLISPTRVRLEGDQLVLEETILESGGSRVTVGGALRAQALDFKLAGELALPLLRLLTPEITAAEGLCGVHLELSGTRERPRLTGVVEPRAGASVTPRAVGKPIEFAEGRVLFSESQIRAEQLHAFGLGGEVWLDGTVELIDGDVIRYDLSGRAEHLLLRVPRVRAEVNADLTLRGAASAPALSGTVEIVEGRFFERYQLRNFTATAASSSGGRSLADLVPSLAATALDVRLSGNDLRAHADMGSIVVQLTGSTNLAIGGSLRDFSVTGAADVTDGRVQVLESRLDVESATVEFPPRPDRRLVPHIDLRARSLIEPAQSPTGAELPVLLTLVGDIERMKLDVETEDSGHQISRVDLLTVLATGRSAQALLGETSGDAALRLVSREVFSDAERRVEGILDQLARGIGGQSIDFVLELGATSARTGLSWELSRRLQIEAETSISYIDDSEAGDEEEGIRGGTVRTALRARYLLADHLPIVDSVALHADWTDLSFSEDVYSSLDLKLKMRIFEL